MSNHRSFKPIAVDALASVSGGIVSFHLECADGAFMAGLRAALDGKTLSEDEQRAAAFTACEDATQEAWRRSTSQPLPQR